MLRIAVPNKGSLSEAACEMLHEAGYRQRKDRELLVADPAVTCWAVTIVLGEEQRDRT